MVCYHGFDCFQGWLVVRGGPKTPRCCRKTWDEVCNVTGFFAFFAEVLIINVILGGPS